MIMVQPRGGNFAIRRETYLKVGGIRQPLDQNAKPLPGEDGALFEAVKKSDGKISSSETTAITSARRVLAALLINSPENFFPNGLDQIRNEEKLLKQAKKLKKGQVQAFTEGIIKKLFERFMVDYRGTETWQKAKKFIYPQEKLFLDDVSRMTIDELYKKYRELFLENIDKIKVQNNIKLS